MRDASEGTEQEKELGFHHQVKFGVVHAVDDDGFHETTLTGNPQPRNWHLSIGKPLFANAEVKDVRVGVALISDWENGFKGYGVTDPDLPENKSNPFYNDWAAEQKSTRVVNYTDPRGRTALFAQLARVTDLPGGQYGLAIPMDRTIAAEDGTTAPAGALFSQDHGDHTGLLDTFFYVNHDDKLASGIDGTPACIAGMRADAHVEDFLDGKHGPVKFDASTDVTQYKSAPPGARYKTTLGIDTGDLSYDHQGHGNVAWTPWGVTPNTFNVPDDGSQAVDGPGVDSGPTDTTTAWVPARGQVFGLPMTTANPGTQVVRASDRWGYLAIARVDGSGKRALELSNQKGGTTNWEKMLAVDAAATVNQIPLADGAGYVTWGANNPTQINGVTISGTCASGKELVGTSASAASWQTVTAGFANPMTTQGDLIVGGAAGAPGRLAIGAANTIFQVNGAGTSGAWTTLSTAIGNAIGTNAGRVLANVGSVWGSQTGTAWLDAAFSTSRGGVIIRGASNWTAASLGTNGQVLSSNGTDLLYQDITAVLDAYFGTTVGNVLVRGSSFWTGLGAAAANGYVLTYDTGQANNVAWEAAPGGGHALLDGSSTTDSVATTVARGMVIVGNATPKWAGVARGAANTIISSDGTDTTFRTLTAVMDGALGSTRGQLSVRGASTWGVLGVGAAGTVLIGGTDPTYSAAPTLTTSITVPIVQVAAVAGTNAVGNVFLTTAGQGTGTGVGGDWLARVAPAGSTGTSVNPLVDMLRLSGNGSLATFGAAAVAFTVKNQDAAGTNTAGANLTYQASAGTGTGAGGSHIFQVAAAGSTGTTVNSFATALTLDATKLATFAGAISVAGSASLATITAGTWNGSVIGSAYLPATVVYSTRQVLTSSPLTGGGDLTADRTISFSNQNANLVLAGPSSGGAAAPTFRALVAADLPAGSAAHALLDGVGNNDTTAGTVVRGDLIVGSSTPKWARLAIGSSGKVLHSDGTDATWQALVAADIPNLDASKITTGLLSVARGGTGLDGSSAANGALLIGNGSGYTLATITQTANQVLVANGGGTITLSTPQNIHTGASPTFANLTLSGALLNVPDAAGTDTAGTGLTSAAGKGTGQGKGGAWVAKVSPPAGSSGSTANALVASLTLDGAGALATFGPVTAASPTAYLVQGSSASGADTAGADLSIAPGQGTGTGAGGTWRVKVAPAGSTGSSLNALAEALRIDSTKLATFSGAISVAGSASLATITAGTWNGTAIAAAYVGNLPASKITSGQLALAQGGTALDTSGVTDGQILIGQTSDHTFGLATISAGTGITVTNAGHSITIASSGVAAHNLLSATHGDTVAASVVRGDVIVGNSTPAWARLAIGASGKVLHSDGTDVTWQSLVAADIPNLDTGKLTTGLLPIARGGTGLSSYSVGDLIQATGTTTLASLAIGSAAYQVLAVNAGGTAPSWQGLSSLLDNGLSASTQGDILYRNATTWVRLGAGTNGQFLTTAGAGANPSWTTSSASPHALLDGTGNNDTLAGTVARGDIIVGNSTPKWARLAKQTNVVLFCDGTDTQWSSTPIILSLTVTGGTLTTSAASGSNTSTTALQLYPGQSTGNVSSGDVQVLVSPAGSSGTSTNNLAGALLLRGDGKTAVLGNASLARTDNAAPTATYTVQGTDVLTGTTDTAGTALVISAGKSTGTGTNGITFKTSPAGLTGSTPNALVAALTLAGSGAATFFGSVAAQSLSLNTPLPVGSGGTGGASWTSGAVLYASGATTIAGLNVGSAYDLLATNAGATGPGYLSLTTVLDNKAGSTRGQLLVRGASAWGVLGIGSANDLLTTNNGATDPAYQSLSAVMDAKLGSTRGQLAVRGASTWGILSIGAANTVLVGGTDPAYSTVTALLDAAFGSTRGMTLFRGSANWTALAAGTSGNFLQTKGSGADPVWAAGGGSAALPTRYVSGCLLSWISTTQLRVSAGVFRDSADAANVTYAPAGNTATLDNTTTGLLGMDTFTLTPTGTTAATTTITASASIVAGMGTKAGLGTTITTVGTALTGVGTKWASGGDSKGTGLGELAVGDLIGRSTTNGWARVVSIESDTAATLSAALPGGDATAVAYTIIENATIWAGATASDKRQIKTLTANGLTIIVEGAAVSTTASGQTLKTSVIPDSGSITGAFWLYCHARSGSSGQTVTIGTQRTTPYNPTALNNYNVSTRRIGAWPVTSAGAFVPGNFREVSSTIRRFLFEEALNTNGTFLLNTGSNAAWTAVACNAVIPPTARLALVVTQGNSGAGGVVINLRERGAGSTAVTRNSMGFSGPAGSAQNNGLLLVNVDAAQYFEYVCGSFWDIHAVGFEEVL